MTNAGQASSIRGEAVVFVGGKPQLLRPTFAALVAAEEELGSLYALVERAGEGRLRLAEVVALFWHCLANQGELSKEDLGEAVTNCGLAAVASPLRTLLTQILQGRM